MKEILKNLKEGDILVKISKNESVWGDSIIEHNSLIAIKILKKVRRSSNKKEDFFINEMKCFSNYNIDNNLDKWEWIDTVSTIGGPSLHSISFIDFMFDKASKNEIDSYSFVVKDDTNKIWEEAMKHYPRIFDSRVLDPKELGDFMDSIAGDSWRICFNRFGAHSF